jgi:murein DD-endopeptidase MepM/ murein hydrolase activator NlpD
MGANLNRLVNDVKKTLNRNSSYKKDVLDKDGIKNFLEETESGPAIGTEFYDADVTSPIEALRHIIRKNYTPDTTSQLKVAKYAVVVATDENRSPLVNVIKGEEKFNNVQLARVRVLSDPRHFWIPVPNDENDPASNFHPLVVHNIAEGSTPLKFGTLVSVEFSNPATQFSSNADVGRVVQVWAESGGYIEETFGEKCVFSLPPLPEPGQQIMIEDCGVTKKLEFTNPEVGSVLAERGISSPGESPKWPVITNSKKYGSSFGMRTLRAQGETEAKTRMHRGVDMRAFLGNLIVSCLDGTVEDVRYNSGWGNFVLVKYDSYSQYGPDSEPQTFYLRYCHLQDPERMPLVKIGQKVFKGSLLGVSAGSGRITAPHLHFEWILGSPSDKSSYADPKTFMQMKWWRVV